MPRRLFVFQCIIVVLLTACLWRLYCWQVLWSPELKAIAAAQYERTHIINTPRGKIVAADGSPLAINKEEYRLFIMPQQLKENPVTLSDTLTRLVFAPNDRIATEPAKVAAAKEEFRLKLIERMSDTSRKWVALASGLSKEQKQAVEALDITALGFEAEERRFYPEGSMSAHILGFVGRNTEGQEQGYFGIEGNYDETLRGKLQRVESQTDALGKPIIVTAQEQENLESIQHVQLSIRRDIQFLLEEKLKEGKEKYGAKSADGIIMDPSTGKIIAMASVPAYDPGKYAGEDPALFKNPAVADSYEPGSTFKVLTVASGIDAGVISPTTACTDCGGPKTIGKYTIKTWNNTYTPNISMTDALVKSDNTAMMFVVDKLGKERFASYIQKFGIGQKTGIDLQDETTAKLRTRWGDIDAATASFGQGVAVTMIQMINAVNAIANDGVLLKPYVVEKLFNDQGEQMIEPTQLRRVVSSETAQIVTNMMIQSASHGDAKWTLPSQYLIAGKTGTAQIPVAGHYDQERTIASFVGFAPADDPKFTMLIRISEPTTSPWGSETAAPLWFTIAKELFIKFGVQPKVGQSE